MTFSGRDVAEVDALVTDRYLDALLASGELAHGNDDDMTLGGSRTGRHLAGRTLDDAVRIASARLTRDLPRFHPSFRFEERLAVRLAEAAVAMRLPAAAGAEGRLTVVPLRPADLPDDFDPLADELDEDADVALLASRPLLIGGAVAASALSLAGAAFVAWRRSRGGSPMGRAARAAHALRGRPA
ncbi:MAG: hypothetical protein AB1736_04965 [Chloroflexota bacterium]